MTSPDYITYVSPDGEHEQKVSATNRVRAVELRHAGWKPKPKPGRTAPVAPAKTDSKENRT
jgi:hypothetical protein